jgi:putative sigma-54 modulation protein
LEVSISARHGTLEKDAHDYIERKVPKISHLFYRVNAVKVTVDLNPDAAAIDVELLVIEPRHTLVARDRAETVQAAFDLAMGRMESQLRKHKEKLHDHHASDKHLA